MLSVTYNKSTHKLQFYYEVYKTIEDLKNYFYSFCGADAEYYMTEAYVHTLENYDSTKGSLEGYIKSIARTISQNTDKKEILVDYSDENFDEDDQNSSYYIKKANEQKNKTDNNFDVESDYLEVSDAIFVLKVEYPVELIYFQRAILKGTTYTDASRDFIMVCQDIIKQFPNFVEEIKNVDLSDIKKEVGLLV